MIGREVRDIREKYGLTQQAFAAALGYSGDNGFMTISRYERDPYKPIPLRAQMAIEHFVTDRETDTAVTTATADTSTPDTPHNASTPELILDPEFKQLISPLDADERSRLEESVILEGCRDPLIV